MSRPPSKAHLSIVLVGWLALGASSARAAEVNDEGGFFSPAAVRKAQDEIRDIQRQHQKDLLIDTFKTVPASKLTQFQSLSGTAQDRFFTEWSQQRYRTARVDGIAVLICRSPAKIRVTVGEQNLKKAFTPADRDRLVELLLTRFKAREYDQGLLESVRHVQARLNANLGVPAPRLASLPAPVANEVKDYAGFFAAQSVRKANAALGTMRQRFRQDVIFETFKTVPPSRIQEVETLSPEARGRFFAGWLQQRARASGVDAIHVLICRQPAHLEIGLGSETRKKAFTPEDRNRLRDLLVARLRDKDYDNGLLQAIALIGSTLERNVPSAPPLRVTANTLTDAGGFFDPATVQKAQAAIKELQQDLQTNLTIETFKSVPPDRAQQLETLAGSARNRFFADWVGERVRASGADGIHVLICRTPSHLEIALGEQVRKAAFTPADRNKLRDLLVAGFKARRYDQTLGEALDLIYDTVDLHKRAAFPAPVVGSIQDHAGIFGGDTVRQAGEKLRAFHQDFGTDVTIETFPRVPPGYVKKVQAMNAEDRNKFLDGWFNERDQTAGGNRIQVLICKQPLALRTAMRLDTAKQPLTPADQVHLRDVFWAGLHEGTPDKALREGLAALDTLLPARLERVPAAGQPGSKPNVAAPASIDQETPPVAPKAESRAAGQTESRAATPTPAPTGGKIPLWVWLVGGAVVLLVLWVIVGVVRALTRPRYPAGYAPGPGGGPAVPPRAVAAGPAAGYGGGGGYPMQGAPAGYPPGGGYPGGGGLPGGGFLPGLLGGMFGGAAGSWMYDRFIRRSDVPFGGAGTHTGYVHDAPRPEARPGPSNVPAAGGDYNRGAEAPVDTAGGDFGSEPAGGVDTAGGDFGAAPAPADTAGGDFGEGPEYAGAGSAGSRGESEGGDFGDEAARGADAGGGDFGDSPEEAAASPGGDFGGDSSDSGDAGSADAGTDVGGGGDFGGGSDAASDSGGDTGGGDFGSSDSGGSSADF